MEKYKIYENKWMGESVGGGEDNSRRDGCDGKGEWVQRAGDRR